jgi:hypothetical protein
VHTPRATGRPIPRAIFLLLLIRIGREPRAGVDLVDPHALGPVRIREVARKIHQRAFACRVDALTHLRSRLSQSRCSGRASHPACESAEWPRGTLPTVEPERGGTDT